MSAKLLIQRLLTSILAVEIKLIVPVDEIVNEARDREKVKELVRLDLDKMMKKSLNPNNSHEDITTIQLDPIEFDGKIFAIIEDRLIKTRFINSKDLQTNE
mgnify:CR=1 FL=1